MQHCNVHVPLIKTQIKGKKITRPEFVMSRPRGSGWFVGKTTESRVKTRPVHTKCGRVRDGVTCKFEAGQFPGAASRDEHTGRTHVAVNQVRRHVQKTECFGQLQNTTGCHQYNVFVLG
jgi:hypothetical protein